MGTRRQVHALVDDLDDTKLELAKLALEEIRGDGFELTEADERELREREAECDRARSKKLALSWHSSAARDPRIRTVEI